MSVNEFKSSVLGSYILSYMFAVLKAITVAKILIKHPVIV